MKFFNIVAVLCLMFAFSAKTFACDCEKNAGKAPASTTVADNTKAASDTKTGEVCACGKSKEGCECGKSCKHKDAKSCHSGKEGKNCGCADEKSQKS